MSEQEIKEAVIQFLDKNNINYDYVEGDNALFFDFEDMEDEQRSSFLALVDKCSMTEVYEE